MTRSPRQLLAAAVAGSLLAAGAARADPARTVHDLRLWDGRPQRMLYETPTVPRATLIMLPGGSGDIGIDRDGTLRHGDNFLVRTAGLWVERGFAVVIPDTIDGENLRGRRSSDAYAGVVRALMAFAHQEAPGPVVLVGTSQGSIAAMNGAAHLPGGEIAAVVLTESVSRRGGSHETVFDAAPERVTVPALVVANQDDTCAVAPPEDAPKIAAAMTETHADLLTVQGGREGSNPCGSLSPHGYAGIEAGVVDAIAAWIDRHL